MAKILRIHNIFSTSGPVDYKGLNIDMFVPGSHIYPTNQNMCVVHTNQEDIPNHADIEVLTQAQYVECMVQPQATLAPSSDDRMTALEDMMKILLGINQ